MTCYDMLHVCSCLFPLKRPGKGKACILHQVLYLSGDDAGVVRVLSRDCRRDGGRQLGDESVRVPAVQREMAVQSVQRRLQASARHRPASARSPGAFHRHDGHRCL